MKRRAIIKDQKPGLSAGKTSGLYYTSTSGLLTWNELQPWQQDNHYIHTHYRPASWSYLKSLSSLFYIHNESVNIHSHLWGALLFFIIPLYLYFSPGEPSEPLKELPHPSPWTRHDTYAFASFFFGATFCLTVSGFYHCFSNHSPNVARWGNQLDYVAIVVLIIGSFLPSVYYGFWCEPALYRAYWTMISTIGLGCAVVSVTPKFRTPIWRPFRAAMFVGMGLSAVIPVIHGLQMYGLENMEKMIGLRWLSAQGMLYLIGAGLYATRVPERWHPGRYDVFGSSHQIFHILIVMAACSHLVGLLKAGQYAHTTGRCDLAISH